jgi:DNA replication protein DnaC
MKSQIQKNKYQTNFDFSEYSNATIFKLLSEYFNKLIYNDTLQKESGIKVIGYIKESEFVDNVRLEERFAENQVLLEFEGLLISMSFEVYKQHGEVYFYVYVSSNKETFYEADSFYKHILSCAIMNSDLKGSAFKMPRNELEWEKITIEEKGFDDIFLPENSLDDLKLYINTATEIDVLMRYLLVGHPGTGKTEATTIISKILNKHGVTVIKTSVCDKIKEKFDLAALLAPSILMIDDIDLSLGSRNKGVHAERLQDFLDILDGTEKLKKNVGVIATTNSTALLDLAVQRPGRFDKVLMFDELNIDNIKNIILKSLKDNFKIKSEKNRIVSLFTDPKLIKLFFDSAVTGAYIYSKIKILKIKVDMLKKQDTVTIEWVINEIKSEMNIWNKVKNTDFLGDKLSNSRKNIGFEEETESSETEKGPDITEEELLSAEEEYDKNNNSSRSLRKRIVKDMQRGRAGLGGSLDDDGE